MVKEDIGNLSTDLGALKLVEEACAERQDKWSDAASMRVQASEMASYDRRNIAEWICDTRVVNSEGQQRTSLASKGASGMMIIPSRPSLEASLPLSSHNQSIQLVDKSNSLALESCPAEIADPDIGHVGSISPTSTTSDKLNETRPEDNYTTLLKNLREKRGLSEPDLLRLKIEEFFSSIQDYELARLPAEVVQFHRTWRATS